MSAILNDAYAVYQHIVLSTSCLTLCSPSIQ